MEFNPFASERNFLLRIEPRDKLTFTGDVKSEIHTTIKLTNKSDSRQAFKIKCTRNDLFRIKPAIGILDYGQTIHVDITYKCINNQVPESNRHHFGIYHIPAPEGATCSGAWAEHYGPPQGELRMKVFFQNAKGRSPSEHNGEKTNAESLNSNNKSRKSNGI